MRISDWSSDVCSSDLPESTLAFARQMIALRREHAALRTGTLTFVDAPEPLLAFERAADDGQRLLCVLNLGHASVDWTPPEPGWRLVAATERGWHDDAPPPGALPTLGGYIASR